MITIKSKREQDLMRETSKLAKSVLEYIEPFIKVGVSTLELNNLCHNYIIERDAYPAPLNYHGFPKSVCTSLNDVICHGIPTGKDIIKNGDLLNIDVTTKLKGFHGDTNKSYLVGEVPSEIRKLVNVTYQCMMEGIKQVRPGGFIGDIGHSIEEIAKDHNYGVVEEYCGHGIGREFHEDPQVVHVGHRGTGDEIKPGMTFTIEPMINLGERYCKLLNDGWTVKTADGKISAQFEHTILVTHDGYEILTLREEEKSVDYRPGDILL